MDANLPISGSAIERERSRRATRWCRGRRGVPWKWRHVQALRLVVRFEDT